MGAKLQHKPQPGDLDWESRTPELVPFVEQLGADGLGALFDLTGTSDRARAREELAPKFRIAGDATGKEQDAVDDAVRSLEAGTLDPSGRVDLKAVKEAVAVMPEQRARILGAFEQKHYFSVDTLLQGRVADEHSLFKANGLLDTHNYVSEGQFDELVRRYSDVRLGRGDLTLDTTGLNEHQAAKFRAGTMSDLGDIMQTRSGRELTKRMADRGLQGNTVTIGPNLDPTSRDHIMVPFSKGNSDGYFGGVGGNSSIHYLPAGNGAPGDPADYRGDQTLYHELTHAEDAISGNWNKVGAKPLSSGDQSEADARRADLDHEYQAMGIGPYRQKRISDYRYAEERRQLGRRPGAGDRTKGVADADLVPRADYTGQVHAHWVE